MEFLGPGDRQNRRILVTEIRHEIDAVPRNSIHGLRFQVLL